jgi:hypothetical protein
LLYRRVRPASGTTGSDEIQKVSLARLKVSSSGLSFPEVYSSSTHLWDMQFLERYDGTIDLRDLCAGYFLSSGSADDMIPDALRGKLTVLMDWGVKQSHLQPHRPYLVAKLLKSLLLLPGVAKVVNSTWLASFLMTWTDKSAYTAVGHSALAAQTLVAELFNNKLIKFEVYLERMIGSGKTYRQSYRSQQLSQYLDFIAQLQVVGLSESVATLRENIIYGFSPSASRVSDHDGVHSAMSAYLDQSSGMTDTVAFFERALPPIPDLLLEMRSPALGAECRLQIDRLHSLWSTLPPLDFSFRLVLLSRLFELQRNHRALCYLSSTCLKVVNARPFKVIDDTIRRWRLLFLTLGDEFPELTFAARRPRKTLIGPPIFLEHLDALQSHIQRMLPHLSTVDRQTLETLYEASRNSQPIETLSALWMMTLELVSRLRAFETSDQTICLVAAIWTAITRSSATAWDTLLCQWVVDASPVSPMFFGTSALCIELLLWGSLDTSLLWNKLIYPSLGTPKQMITNTLYLQPLASLCYLLLPTDDTVSKSPHDLMLGFAVNTDFATMADTGSLVPDFLQRLPSICLLLKDIRGADGSKSIYQVVATSQLQSVATKHSSVVKTAFGSAISQIPGKRAFFESILRILFAQPQDGKAFSLLPTETLIAKTGSHTF